MPIVAPRRMMNNVVSNTPELSGGGGGPQSVSSRMLVVLVDEANAGGTPCEDQERRPLAGTMKPSSGTVSDDDIGSPCVGEGGGGVVPFCCCREAPSG